VLPLYSLHFFAPSGYYNKLCPFPEGLLQEGLEKIQEKPISGRLYTIYKGVSIHNVFFIILNRKLSKIVAFRQRIRKSSNTPGVHIWGLRSTPHMFFGALFHLIIVFKTQRYTRRGKLLVQVHALKVPAVETKKRLKYGSLKHKWLKEKAFKHGKLNAM
jgi:hypothetical protein